MSENCDVIVIFPILRRFGAIRKPDSRRMISKTFIFINSNFFLQKLKTELKILPHNFHAIALSKGTIFDKKADITKIKKVMELKGIFSKTTYMCVLMNQISSIWHDSNEF